MVVSSTRSWEVSALVLRVYPLIPAIFCLIRGNRRCQSAGAPVPSQFQIKDGEAHPLDLSASFGFVGSLCEDATRHQRTFCACALLKDGGAGRMNTSISGRGLCR